MEPRTSCTLPPARCTLPLPYPALHRRAPLPKPLRPLAIEHHQTATPLLRLLLPLALSSLSYLTPFPLCFAYRFGPPAASIRLTASPRSAAFRPSPPVALRRAEDERHSRLVLTRQHQDPARAWAASPPALRPRPLQPDLPAPQAHLLLSARCEQPKLPCTVGPPKIRPGTCIFSA